VSAAAHAAPAATGRAGSPLAVWGALGVVYVVWGSTYLAIRVMVETAPPLLAAGARFLLAGAIVLGWLAARGGLRRLRLTRAEWAGCAVFGLLLPAGGNGLVTVAERDVPSALAALIIASVPLWVALWRAATRERMDRVALAGVLAGFAGVAVLLVPGNRPDGATTAGSGRREAPEPRGTCWPDWLGFLPPPHRSVHAVLPHTAHRRSSPPAFSSPGVVTGSGAAR